MYCNLLVLVFNVLPGCTHKDKQESEDDDAQTLFSGDNDKIRA